MSTMSELISDLRHLERCFARMSQPGEGLRPISAEDEETIDREQLLVEVQQLRRQRDAMRLRLQRIMGRLEAWEAKLLEHRNAQR